MNMLDNSDKRDSYNAISNSKHQDIIDRINRNEERLDSIISSINNLEKALEEFKSNKKNIYLLSRYYGSNNWFKDKKAYESNKIPKVKAGVLSEDAVWDVLDDIDNLILKMKKIIDNYK